ncbi:MAG: response regulator [Elusimicrobia bacterium]|nr:response regulator [Elusimicrobiota bacterium]
MPAKKKILAVDDDAGICELFEKGLPPLGYEVVCAASGKQAKTFLEKETPDLILMDIMMPDIDGITLTREICSNPKTAKIPILVVSGLSDAATLNDALLFGAVDYIVKPLDFAVLKTKIERILALKEKH